jgi:hypothetical protein
MGLMNFIADRLTNVMSGLGTTIDRRTSASYAFNLVTTEQAEAAYRTGWLGRKIVDIPPLDMTREWRAWQADDKQIELLEEEEKRLQIQHKCKRALTLARLFGGGALILGTGDLDPTQEMDPEKVGKEGLRYVRVMSRLQLNIGNPRLDPEDPWVDQPEYFEIATGAAAHQRQKLHPSRVIPFVGQQAPEGCYHRGESWFWGDSIFQSINDAVQNAELAQAGFAALIEGSAIDILKMPDLTEIASTAEGEAKIINRLTATMLGKSTWRALLLDAEDEWEQRQINWAGIPDVINAFLQICSGAADIPVTRLLGQSPKGLQSTGDGEERDYHSMIAARQDEILLPALERLDELLIRSALGDRPKEIYFEFNPLSELSEKDAATVDKQTADTLKTYGDTGLIHEEALAEIARNKMIETGRWPGCEAAFKSVDNALAEGPDEEAILEQAQALASQQAKGATTPAKLQKQGAITKQQANDLLLDAQPRTLYIRRDLRNASSFLAWARGQGFKSTLQADDLHVTVCYSRKPVDWLKMGSPWDEDDKGQLRVKPGGARVVEALGDKGAVVLLFGSSQLSWRHEELVRHGASHDFDDYQPHVTITYDGGDVDLELVEPYRGELLFGPEIFEELDEDWSMKLVETGSKKR